MSASEERVLHTHTYVQSHGGQVRVKLERNSKSCNWELDVIAPVPCDALHDDVGHELIETLDSLDRELRRRFKREREES